MHGLGDFQDEVAVEGRLVEDFIDMVAGAMDFARQPTCAALVFVQLLADKVSNMDMAFFGFHCLAFCLGFGFFTIWATKKRKPIFLCRRRLWNAFRTISNQIHAKQHEPLLAYPCTKNFPDSRRRNKSKSSNYTIYVVAILSFLCSLF